MHVPCVFFVLELQIVPQNSYAVHRAGVNTSEHLCCVHRAVVNTSEQLCCVHRADVNTSSEEAGDRMRIRVQD